MRKRIAIAAAITASLALWAAVSPQTTVDREVPTPSQTTAVTAPQATPSEPTEPTPLLTTEMEEVDGTIVDPETAKAIRSDRKPEHDDTCSMCGKFCAVRSMNKALAGEHIDIL